ncbi:unnamed protein product, partial [marine sediment metagenome]
MGQVKHFAIWLSDCVYQLQMTDMEILSAVKPLRTDTQKGEDDQWLSEQIEVVRNHTTFYE